VSDSILRRETARGAMTGQTPGQFPPRIHAPSCSGCGAIVLTAAFSCVACGAVRSDPVLPQRFEDLRTSDDLDGLVKRRFVRVLVVYSKTFYFIDRGRERGMVAEGIQAFEAYLNRSLKIRTLNEYVHVVAVPVARDQLVSGLIEGRGCSTSRTPTNTT
jgi:hypothetical protein